METQICKTCTYFHQHYTINESCCMPVNCGHCSRPRLKNRKPNEKACPYYLKSEGSAALPDREKVVHFLTTTMLEYILKLELPYDVATE